MPKTKQFKAGAVRIKDKALISIACILYQSNKTSNCHCNLKNKRTKKKQGIWMMAILVIIITSIFILNNNLMDQTVNSNFIS